MSRGVGRQDALASRPGMRIAIVGRVGGASASAPSGGSTAVTSGRTGGSAVPASGSVPSSSASPSSTLLPSPSSESLPLPGTSSSTTSPSSDPSSPLSPSSGPSPPLDSPGSGAVTSSTVTRCRRAATAGVTGCRSMTVAASHGRHPPSRTVRSESPRHRCRAAPRPLERPRRTTRRRHPRPLRALFDATADPTPVEGMTASRVCESTHGVADSTVSSGYRVDVDGRRDDDTSPRCARPVGCATTAPVARGAARPPSPCGGD